MSGCISWVRGSGLLGGGYQNEILETGSYRKSNIFDSVLEAENSKGIIASYGEDHTHTTLW